MIKQRPKTITFDNPIAGGYQTFKKVFGVILVLVAIYAGGSICLFGIKAIKGQVTLTDNSFIKQIVPEDGAGRSFKLNLPTDNPEKAIQTVIEIPRNMLLVSALFIGTLIFGLIARLIIALLNGGISLMKDDVSFVFERLRREIERNKIPTISTDSDLDRP